jgi:Rrf2 family protein
VKVTLKTRYGIVAALDLALQDGPGPVQAKTIAQRQDIPARFLEQVLSAMKKGGLVESVRGAQGGYVLSKDAGDTSLADIIHALDGTLEAPGQKSKGTRRGGNPQRCELLLAAVWEQVREAERAILASVTLSELAERYRRLEHEQAVMYHI